jgi:hypothetical protein
MATSITWTDGVGAATLNNGKPVPADRFSQWEPSSPLVGAEEEALGTGQLYTFTFRTEYLVTFELRMIPQSSMALMLRLQRWLSIGGTVSVNTGDASSHVYATCCRQKGTDSKPRLTDAKNLEYSMSFALRNVAGSPVDFICAY